MKSLYLKSISYGPPRIFLRKLRTHFLKQCGYSDPFDDLARISRVMNCDVCVDIGCHQGQTSLRLMETGLRCPILAVDPFADNLQKAKKALAGHDTVTFCEAAISDTNGDARFFINRNEQTSSLLVNASGNVQSFGADTELAKTITVQTLTLDTLVSRMCHSARRIIIKSDTQGAEAKVIRGGLSTIKDKCVAFYAEFMLGQMYEGQASFEELRDLLENKCGMVLRDIYPCLHGRHGDAAQADALWVKPSALDYFIGGRMLD
jgi:FkbM family methyltransferase